MASPPPPPPRKSQTLLIDTLSCGTTTCLSIFFIFALTLSGIVGALGPARTVSQSVLTTGYPPWERGGADPIVFVAPISDLTPYSQYAMFSAQLYRPLDTAGVPALFKTPIYYQLPLTIAATGVYASGAPFTTGNASHVRSLNCPELSPLCTITFLMVQAPVYDTSSYSIQLEVAQADVFAGFSGVELMTPQKVQMRVVANTVSPQYTKFEIGYKLFLVSLSVVVAVFYIAFLRCGKGAKDAAGIRLPLTLEQGFVLGLVIVLPFFNDPSIILQITAPTLGASVFYAVSSVSFLALLLMFWLVTLHTSTLEGERRSGGGDGGGGVPVTVGSILCFWMPKIVTITLLWVALLSAILWFRFQLYTDPATSVSEMGFGTYVQDFAYIIEAAYLLQIAYFWISSMRHCVRVSNSKRFVFVITTVTFIIALIGSAWQGVGGGMGRCDGDAQR